MKYRSAAGTVVTSICGKYYLVTAEKTISINETAAYYWAILNDGADENELFEKVIKVFDIEDESALHNEIHELIENLSRNRLVVRYDM